MYVIAKDDISGGDSGIEASGETERSLRVSTSSEERDLLSRTPDSLQGAENEEIRTDSALGGPTDTHKAASEELIDVTVTEELIDVSVTDVLDGRGVRFRGSRSGKGKRSSSSPPADPAVSVVENRVELERNDVVEDEEDLEPDTVRTSPVWNFPPTLEDFDLMESDVDPTQLEEMFADDRLIEVKLRVNPNGPGVGLSIVGGSGSPNGDLPILIKRILPGSLAEENGRLKPGDELVAVNETLLVGVPKDFAINALSKMEGEVRLLVLQDD